MNFNRSSTDIEAHAVEHSFFFSIMVKHGAALEELPMPAPQPVKNGRLLLLGAINPRRAI
jgi:hypothetical protein